MCLRSVLYFLLINKAKNCDYRPNLCGTCTVDFW